MKMKVLAIILLVLLAFSLGCTQPEADDDAGDGQTGGDITAGGDTAEVDEALDDISADIEGLEDLLDESDMNIDDIGIDEDLI